MSTAKEFDGSRRHILDWVETLTFIDSVRGWIHDQALIIPDRPTFMPKSCSEPDEPKLFDAASPFLSGSKKANLRKWWLAHAANANIPNWDL